MDRKNMLIILLCFLLGIIILFVWSNLERNNIIFKKCLDVISQENLIEVNRFRVNVETCEKQF